MKVLVDFREALGPVRDQRQRPTCAAFAGAATHRFDLDRTVILSPEWLDFKAKARFPHKGSGMTFKQLSEVIQFDGQVDEVDCPYCLTEPLADWRPNSGLAGKYFTTCFKPGIDFSGLYGSIERRRPVILGLMVTDPFLRGGYGKPKRIDASDLSVNRWQSGHAVVLCGAAVHAGTTYLLVRNSWGLAWGDQGHCWLSQSVIEKTYIDAVLLDRKPK